MKDLVIVVGRWSHSLVSKRARTPLRGTARTQQAQNTTTLFFISPNSSANPTTNRLSSWHHRRKQPLVRSNLFFIVSSANPVYRRRRAWYLVTSEEPRMLIDRDRLHPLQPGHPDQVQGRGPDLSKGPSRSLGSVFHKKFQNLLLRNHCMTWADRFQDGLSREPAS